MQISQSFSVSQKPLLPGAPVATLAAVDRGTGASTPMAVYARDMVGRFDGYSSLATALTAAKRLSKGEDHAALAIVRGTTGMYEVREAVWQLLGARTSLPGDRAQARQFHFEDGTFSAYSAVVAGRRFDVSVLGTISSVTGAPVALVDGGRVLES